MQQTTEPRRAQNGRLDRWWLRALAASVLLAGLLPTWAGAATPQKVDEAIEKGKACLLKEMKNGNWEGAITVPLEQQKIISPEVGGVTALVTYALLATGEKPDEPHLAQAIKYLQTCPMDGTYAVAMRSQVWLNLPDEMRNTPAIQKLIRQDATTLLQGGHPDLTLGGHVPSMFYYYYTVTGKIPAELWDHSNSQFGVLGMWACEQAGFEVSQKYWQAVDGGWRAHQQSTGAWGYCGTRGVQNASPTPIMDKNIKQSANVDPSPRPSMTAAGVATLFITDDYLHGMDGINCTGNIVDTNIEAGIKWITDNFKDVFKGQMPTYNLYGIERIGLASGYKYFGTLDWFKEGADYLIPKQGANGAWGSTINTSFAILFLARGRAPVAFNKLQYNINSHGDTPKPANWNERPRDVANLTHWIGKQIEQPILNWQIVNLEVPVEELHDAPILYIAGNQPVDFTSVEIGKLRQFVEEGGLIVANADCGRRNFATAFKKVSGQMFPDYEFRPLPLTSPIYTNEIFPRSKWRTTAEVEALSNGDRELVIVIPERDPARYWQTQASSSSPVDFQLGCDIFCYAVTRGTMSGSALRKKGETYLVASDPAVKAKGQIKVGRLQYGGNWNPEPAGWRRLGAIMHNRDACDLDVQGVNLGEGKLDATYKVASLTGPFKFSLTQPQRDEIRKYVEGGGTLIVDACGGSGEFAQSAQGELAAIFPDAKLPEAPLGLDSPVFAAGKKLERVDYRPTAKKIVGALQTPRLRAMTINGRLAVFFSGEDLSCGLVGVPVDGIYGYDPDSATAIMEKLVLFANH